MFCIEKKHAQKSHYQASKSVKQNNMELDMDEWKIIPGNSKGRRQDVIPQIKHMWSNRNVSDYIIRQQPKIIESTKEKPFKVVLFSLRGRASKSERT